jgi:dTDP-4-amino-4,6-dideoxygalactose transaminase
MSRNPHAVTEEFERALCEYTGAPYAVAVNSCTMAILLAVDRAMRFNDRRGPMDRTVEIPKRTYISVPMSIRHAGAWPIFRDETWESFYELRPLNIWDSARYFSSGMFKSFSALGARYVCVSFHASKTLGLEQGGAILHDDAEADLWFRRARFDGRTPGVAPKDDTFDMIGYHCYLNPSTAAQGILRLHSLPKHNAPLPNDDYPNLSAMEIFR